MWGLLAAGGDRLFPSPALSPAWSSSSASVPGAEWRCHTQEPGFVLSYGEVTDLL